MNKKSVRSAANNSAVQGQLKDVQQIQASCGTFAAFHDDRSVVAWGDPDCGGDSEGCAGSAEGCAADPSVSCFFRSHDAVPAILGDGSVVTWGDADSGCDSNAVQGQLKDVQQIQASYGAVAAILDDGSVVTWGHADVGGNSQAVQGQLN